MKFTCQRDILRRTINRNKIKQTEVRKPQPTSPSNHHHLHSGQSKSGKASPYDGIARAHLAQISQGQRQKLESRQFTPIQFTGSLTQLSFTFSPSHTILLSPNDVSQTVRGLWQPSIISLFEIPSTYTQLQTGQERTGSTCSVATSFYGTFHI